MTGCTTLTSSSGSFTSFGYPNNYANNQNVCWLIVSQNSLRISFPDFYTEENRDFVRVYGGESTSYPLLLEVSGKYDENKGGYYLNTAVSPTNQMLVIFSSDSSNTYKGFLGCVNVFSPLF